MKTLYWSCVLGAGVYFFTNLTHVHGIYNAHRMDCKMGIDGTHNCWVHRDL